MSEELSPAALVPLSEIPAGHRAPLAASRLGGLVGERLADLGFTKGTTVQVVRRGPKNALIAVSIRNTVIALRNETAEEIMVFP